MQTFIIKNPYLIFIFTDRQWSDNQTDILQTTIVVLTLLHTLIHVNMIDRYNLLQQRIYLFMFHFVKAFRQYRRKVYTENSHLTALNTVGN